VNLVLLREDIERDEGKKLRAYRDSQGYWTIGIGHLLGSSPRMTDITEAECTALYNFDISEAIDLARSIIPQFDTLDDVRQRALTNMAFNRGEHMKTSTTITPAIIKGVETGVWTGLKSIIEASEWASQVGARALRLAQMLEDGR
jgi:lysozyme